MSRLNREKIKKTVLLTAVFSVFPIGLPTIPLVAQTLPIGAKPCARIFYEEPYDDYVIVPEECPPNTATQQARETGRLSDRQEDAAYGSQLEQVPDRQADDTYTIPTEQSSEPVATVIPAEGTVDVMLKNNTNAVVRYQAVGYTDYLSLEGGAEVLIENVPLPSTVTFARQDDGFVEVKPVTATDGMLTVNLDEDRTPLDRNQGVLRIRESGQVYLD
jgi:hypothetical protein